MCGARRPISPPSLRDIGRFRNAAVDPSQGWKRKQRMTMTIEIAPVTLNGKINRMESDVQILFNWYRLWGMAALVLVVILYCCWDSWRTSRYELPVSTKSHPFSNYICRQCGKMKHGPHGGQPGVPTPRCCDEDMKSLDCVQSLAAHQMTEVECTAWLAAGGKVGYIGDDYGKPILEFRRLRLRHRQNALNLHLRGHPLTLLHSRRRDCPTPTKENLSWSCVRVRN